MTAAEFIKVFGRQIPNMVAVTRNFLIKPLIKVFTLMESLMDWEDSRGRTENSTKESGKMDSSMVQGCGKELKAIVMLEIGNSEKLMVTEFITG